MGAWQFAEPRGGGPEPGLILAGSPGYPNEAAAEVVLTALREWLEQHKDKVRPVPSRGDWTGWGSGVHSGPATSPHQSSLRARVQSTWPKGLWPCQPFLHALSFP